MKSSPATGLGWERWNQVLSDWMPYASLVISISLALLGAGQSRAHRLEIVGLTLAAAGWTYVMYTRAPQPRTAHQLRSRVYFLGFLVLVGLLMQRELIYFVYAITGFFHTSTLRPFWVAILGVALTSILINTLTTGFPWEVIDLWFVFGTLTVIQTLVIGSATVMGEKMAELSEQRRQAVAKLEAALQENAGLQAQLVAKAREAGVLDERQRMAREIHDTLAQGLTGIITQLEAAAQAHDHPAEWQRHVDNAAKLARSSLTEARRSVEAGRPGPLESAPLPEALAEVAQQWSALSGVPVDVTITGEPLALHPELETTLLRTAQEALANVARHAQAKRAGLTLSYMGDVVTLDVRDDGVGFVATQADGGRGTGFGLTAMRQRVSRVAGTLDIESAPGEGTAISARVPALALQAESAEP